MRNREKNGIRIGATGLRQICLVTKDLELAERRWSKILGIEAEHLVTPVWSEVPSYTNGEADRFREKFILFRLDNDVILEIYGPGETSGNPWGKYLEEYGEGVMNLAFYVDNDRSLAYGLIEEATGVGKPYHEGFYPSCTYSFVGTQKELGVELNIKCEEDNRETIRRLNNDPALYQN